MMTTPERQWMTPSELASLLVDYFSTPPVRPLTAREIQETWEVPRSVCSRAITIARAILREDYDIFLPIAHRNTNYILTPTKNPFVAYYGELPQIRDLNSRAEHTYDRLSYVLRRLDKTAPLRAKQQDRALRTAFDAFDAALENADGWITEQIGNAS